MTNVLIAMRGYPCSGKSTEAWKIAEAEDAVVVNRDLLRNMMFGKLPPDEKLVSSVEMAVVRKLLAARRSVVVDDMNLVKKQLVSLAYEAIKFDAEFEIYDVPTPAEECIKRSLISANLRGKDAISGLAGRHPIDKWPDVDDVYDAAFAAFEKTPEGRRLLRRRSEEQSEEDQQSA